MDGKRSYLDRTVTSGQDAVEPKQADRNDAPTIALVKSRPPAVRERIGIYTIDDELPRPESMVDDGEYERMMARSRRKT